MYDIDYNTSTRGLRRTQGYVGGVSAGLGARLGIDSNVLRLGWVVGGLALGGPVVLAYLIAWLIVPADETLPPSRRPASVPKALLWLLVAVVGFQLVFGLVTNLPLGWIAVGALGAWWFLRRGD